MSYFVSKLNIGFSLLKIAITIFFLFANLQSFSNENSFIDIQNYFMKDQKINSKLELMAAKSPLYKKQKKYEGYSLKYLFKLKNIDISKLDVVTFKAKDGFKITISGTFIEKNNPFLAVRDTSLPVGKNWEVVAEGGRKIDGGPYYLMWDIDKYSVPENYWAFGVVSISFTTFKEAFGASVPLDLKNKFVMSGFQVYQTSCSGCHSVNLVGGDLGLEMNVPKNFTEYLSKEFILNYAKSPTSYRVNAKMPPQHFLSDKEINSVITYLEAMKLNKICNSDKQCQKRMDKKIN